MLGVEQKKDLEYIEAKNLFPVLRLVQSRKLKKCWDEDECFYVCCLKPGAPPAYFKWGWMGGLKKKLDLALRSGSRKFRWRGDEILN